jgi:hypothetical protein
MFSCSKLRNECKIHNLESATNLTKFLMHAHYTLHTAHTFGFLCWGSWNEFQIKDSGWVYSRNSHEAFQQKSTGGINTWDLEFLGARKLVISVLRVWGIAWIVMFLGFMLKVSMCTKLSMRCSCFCVGYELPIHNNKCGFVVFTFVSLWAVSIHNKYGQIY